MNNLDLCFTLTDVKRSVRKEMGKLFKSVMFKGRRYYFTDMGTFDKTLISLLDMAMLNVMDCDGVELTYRSVLDPKTKKEVAYTYDIV